MHRASIHLACCAAAWLAIVVGCGGKAVIDPDGSGGSAGATTTITSSTTSITTTTPTTTTTVPYCTSHADCQGYVCVFATGQCVPGCAPGACDSCQAGVFCEPCATSSCPECNDCVAACVPATAGRCDEDDPCPGQQICAWAWGTCLEPCGPGGDCGGWSYCDGCVTGSCCGCDDCVAACMGGE